MKFSNYFFAPNTRLTATVMGVLFGVPTAIFMGWPIGLISGACIAILASLVIPFMVYRADRPYEEIKKTLRRPFLFDERVRFTVVGGNVTGFFILTEESMVFLSLDKGNHHLELSRDDVSRVILNDHVSLHIYLDEKKFIQVTAAASEQMFRVLRENGWKTVGGNH